MQRLLDKRNLMVLVGTEVTTRTVLKRMFSRYALLCITTSKKKMIRIECERLGIREEKNVCGKSFTTLI